MSVPYRYALLGWLLLFTVSPASLEAQDRAPFQVLHGRVEGASSGLPLAGVRVFSGDFLVAVSDSAGTFAAALTGEPPFSLETEGFGYRTRRFELGADATGRISVLQLDPAPMALEGIEVIGEARISRVIEGMARQRRGYPGAVRVLDRDDLSELPVSNALQLVLSEVSWLRECEIVDSSYPVGDRLCGQLPNRAPTTLGRAGPVTLGFSGRPESARAGSDLAAGPTEILVCINGRQSYSHDTDLSAIPIGDVAVFEHYGRPVADAIGLVPDAGQIRIYTRLWLVSRARQLARFQTPALMGC